MKINKVLLLKKLQDRISHVQKSIDQNILKTEELASKSIGEIKSLNKEDQSVYFELQYHATNRIEELKHLKGSPFFVRCDLVHTKNGEQNTYYFAKHQLTEESIYSWVAPLSSIRFENPGSVTYKLPDGTIEKATLLRKEQYMIVDGKVLFFALEEKDSPRDLIYQEHFSTRRSGFVLPEIVAVMEKAQDQIIRAHHSGSFVISGPAGSGKTTLALHRVAYLVQAPDTAIDYPTQSVIIFVQDTGTKDYFSNLLPELGIKGVTITTFALWSMDILGIIDKAFYINRPGSSEFEKDLYEHEKLSALRNASRGAYQKNYHVFLENVYSKYLSDTSKKIFEVQKKEKTFDKIDLTILLRAYFEKHPKLEKIKEYVTPNKNGDLQKKRRRISIEHSLVVVDEFQNSLPEQLLFYKKILNKKNKSIIYVGDMAQQVQFGTLKDWVDIGEDINSERKVVLQKVYRNTKQILQYIESLGYKVSIPDGIKEGSEVLEKTDLSQDEQLSYVTKIIQEKSKDSRIGILAKEELVLKKYKDLFKNNNNIHILTMAEAQGVEFDSVILVEIHKNLFAGYKLLPDGIQAEKKRVEKDLLYVALTRAIKELYIVGESSLKEVVKEIIS